MKLFFNIGIILCMFSLFFGYSSLGHQSPHYVKIASEITDKTGKELKKGKNLNLVGTGGGMMNDIQMMAMSFQYFQEVDLQTARELLIYVINKYLSNVNGNEEVRPFLHDYPFTVKNIEIRIWIYSADRSRLSPDKICYVSSIKGIIDYYTQELGPYQEMREETYEEAVKLIHTQVN